MNEIRIREDLPLEVAYSLENPPSPPPIPPRRLKYEREQKRLDRDKKAWRRAMVWGMWTTGK
jgi:hypothetical protein